MKENEPLKDKGYIIAPLYDAKEPKFKEINEIRKSELVKNFDEHLQELRFNKPYSSKELGVVFETNYIKELKEVLEIELPKRNIKIIESQDGRSLMFAPNQTADTSIESALKVTENQTVTSKRTDKLKRINKIRTNYLGVKKNDKKKIKLKLKKEILEAEKNLDADMTNIFDWLDETYGAEIINLDKMIFPQRLVATLKERSHDHLWFFLNKLVKAGLLKEIESGLSYQVTNPTNKNQLLQKRMLSLPLKTVLSWPTLFEILKTQNRQVINKLLYKLTEHKVASNGVMIIGFK